MEAQTNAIALSGRVLGALFYYPPDSPQSAPLVASLRTGEGLQQWPVSAPALTDIAERIGQPVPESIPEAWQRLFIGPNILSAPPWGSAWLDRENALFGESMLALRHWLDNNQLCCGTPTSEPCDHIGILLMLAAWLAENGRQRQLEELLAWHLFPWSFHYLQRLIASASHPFWQGVGELAQLSLTNWRATLSLPVADKPLWL